MVMVRVGSWIVAAAAAAAVVVVRVVLVEKDIYSRVGHTL